MKDEAPEDKPGERKVQFITNSEEVSEDNRSEASIEEEKQGDVSPSRSALIAKLFHLGEISNVAPVDRGTLPLPQTPSAGIYANLTTPKQGRFF